jgi:hypothetical protein
MCILGLQTMTGSLSHRYFERLYIYIVFDLSCRIEKKVLLLFSELNHSVRENRKGRSLFLC